jgi:hypothetical protein
VVESGCRYFACEKGVEDGNRAAQGNCKKIEAVNMQQESNAGAKTRSRKVREGNSLLDRHSPLDDLKLHWPDLLCVVAPWRPCVEIRLPY